MMKPNTPKTLSDIKFGCGQIKISKLPYTIPSNCLDGTGTSCAIAKTSSDTKYTCPQYGKYLKLNSNNNDTIYRYRADVYDKTDKLINSKGLVKIENLTEDYLIISNDKMHALLSIKTLLSIDTLEIFKGVSQAALTTVYINSKAAGGSQEPLISGLFSKIKFSIGQIATVDYSSDCSKQACCVINSIIPGYIRFAGSTPIVDDGLSDNLYLRLEKVLTKSPSVVKYALNLYDEKNILIANIVKNGKIVSIYENGLLIIDEITKYGFLMQNHPLQQEHKLFHKSQSIGSSPTDVDINEPGFNYSFCKGFLGMNNPTEQDLDVMTLGLMQ